MFRPKRTPIALLLPLVLVGLSISASEALGQKAKETLVFAPPTVSLAADQAVLNACEGDTIASLVRLNARATSASGNPIRYNWTTSAGRIDGNGDAVTWDLSGVRPGYYKAFLAVGTGIGDESCEAFSSIAVFVKCPPPPPPVCPSVYITCPDRVELDQPVTFTSSLTGGSGNVTPNFNWTVSAGRIIEGQGTASIKVDTAGLAGQTLRATLSMGGYPLDCSASCSVSFPVPLKGKKFDEFGEIARNDEKARLDNYAIDLQNDPSSKAYVIVYPAPGGRSAQVQTQRSRIVDYLVNSRGFDAGRIVTVVGPPRSYMTVELWIVPQGATPPTPAP
ncbi:MAG: hypothetical protein ND866_16605 [Pyrinomonadaceae bacterium]|nr:hypothetical protein [Pyrinomonadaceae bacterium]